VTVKLEFGSYNRVSTCSHRGKTSVVGTTCGFIVVREVDRGVIVGSCTTTKRKECFAYFGGSLESSSLRTSDIHNEFVGEGSCGPSRFYVGSEGSKRVKETVRLDFTEGIVIEVISVVVPLVHVGLDNGVTLDNPDKFLDRVVEVKFNLNVLKSDGFVTGEL
jgi:hypothetical protein